MEPTSYSDLQLASKYALQVALQTMKERCISLQGRLTNVEEQNLKLHKYIEGSQLPAPKTDITSNGAKEDATENFQLRLQLADLQRRKNQLHEHMNMVSNENRRLWSRLSEMAKEQDKPLPSKENDCTLINDEAEPTTPRSGGSANQNLIRSKTFTQHSPNPHLRHKLMANEECTVDLEQNALVATNTGAGEDNAEPNETELGFTFGLNIDENITGDSTNEMEFNVEAKKCLDGLQELRREALRQQQDLHSTLAVLESRCALQPCPECMMKSQKPEMADKSLETDESLSEVKFYNNNQLVQKTNYNIQKYGDSTGESVAPRLNILQEKIQADAMDKTCPMCGKIFSSLVTFNAFEQHVETHFIDDSSDIEGSMERNFEFISHTVGDF